MFYVLGDSHALAFSGIEKSPNELPVRKWVLSQNKIFNAINVGPFLAFNLSKSDKKNIIENILLDVPIGSKVIFCFGEIDCRAHLVNQAKKQSRSIKDVAYECASAYLSFVKNITRDKFEPSIWNVIPAYEVSKNSQFPYRGKLEERLLAIMSFNDRLSKGNFPFISITNSLNSDNKLPKRYYIDTLHLNPKIVTPLIIKKMKEIKLL